MDVSLSTEQVLEDRLASVLREFMALDEFYHDHMWLETQTLFLDVEQEAQVACSQWEPERESLYHTIAMQLNEAGIVTSAPPDPDQIGIMQLTVRRADADIASGFWEQRREHMLLGLRQIVAAWASYRRRMVIACTHSGQYDEDRKRMADHIHVLYQKESHDAADLLRSEIETYVASGCKWDKIDESLGIFGAAETPEFDDEYDDQEMPNDLFGEDGYDSSDEAGIADEADEFADYMDAAQAFADMEPDFAFDDPTDGTGDVMGDEQ